MEIVWAMQVLLNIFSKGWANERKNYDRDGKRNAGASQGLFNAERLV